MLRIMLITTLFVIFGVKIIAQTPDYSFDENEYSISEVENCTMNFNDWNTFQLPQPE